jgi:hypothetical protein
MLQGTGGTQNIGEEARSKFPISMCIEGPLDSHVDIHAQKQKYPSTEMSRKTLKGRR